MTLSTCLQLDAAMFSKASEINFGEPRREPPLFKLHEAFFRHIYLDKNDRNLLFKLIES